MMNELVYGTDERKNVVNVEIVDDQAEIMYNDGTSEIVENKFWITVPDKISNRWERLEGDLHYKYVTYYDKATDYYKAKRILKSKDIDFYTVSDPKEAFMVSSGITYFKGLKPKDVSVLSFDIETTGLERNDGSRVLLISNSYRSNSGDLVRKLFSFDEFENEGVMLTAWCDWVREIDPSVIVGHNVYSYDLPYMQHVADRNNVELALGRDGSSVKFFKYESKKRIDGSRDQAYNKMRVFGREVIDTMFLAINYDVAAKKYESYALKKIVAQEGLEVPGRQFYDASKIRDRYKDPNEWELIKKYAMHDADDALALYDLMCPAYFYLCQAVPKSFQSIIESASGAQINSMMVRSYVAKGHSLPKSSEVVSYEGAISFGNPGIYRNCFKVDVASLYPNIMIEWEVYDKVKDPLGHMKAMVSTFTAERLKNKKLAKDTGEKHYDDLQNAQKIVINSFYGFLGAAGLLFNSPSNAAFVTAKGRQILQKSLDWATGRGFKVVNADTDSITFCDPDLDMSIDYRKELLDNLNSLYPNRIKFEDDGYYHTIVVLAAKNYILFDGTKIKTKGSSLKDSKKEVALKQFMNSIIVELIKGKNQFEETYNAYVKEAMNVTDINRWASKKTISAKVLNNERTNEAKIREAIAGSEIVEGDKVYMFFKTDGSLCLAEQFDGDYDRMKLLEKLYKTALTFESVIPKETFVNYKLKRNASKLEEILSPTKEEHGTRKQDSDRIVGSVHRVSAVVL